MQRDRVGWLAFVVSAVLFGLSGVRAGDWLVVVASAIFGAACVLFLISDAPTSTKRASRRPTSPPPGS